MLPIKCHNTQTCVSTFHEHCMSGVCLCVCLFIVAVITCCEVWQAAASVVRTQYAGFNPFMQLTQCGPTVKMSKQSEENQNNRKKTTTAIIIPINVQVRKKHTYIHKYIHMQVGFRTKALKERCEYCLFSGIDQKIPITISIQLQFITCLSK